MGYIEGKLSPLDICGGVKVALTFSIHKADFEKFGLMAGYAYQRWLTFLELLCTLKLN